MLRRSTVLLMAPVAGLMLAGCNSTGDLSCGEFNAQDSEKQAETLRDLLDEHDLDTSDYQNQQGVAGAVASLCASGGSAKLDDATDWDSDYW